MNSPPRPSSRIALAVAVALSALLIPASAHAQPVTQDGWTTSAAAPARAVAGTPVVIRADVTSDKRTNALVDIEIYGPNWQKVAQRFWDNEPFTPGTARTFEWTWTVPNTSSAGTYHVAIGVFIPGWGVVWHWNATAATMQVDPATSITVPTTPPATTAPAPTTVVLPTTTTAPRPPTTTVAPTTTAPPAPITTVALTTTTTRPTTTTAPSPSTTAPAPNPLGGFLATFDGAPTTARAWEPTNWAVDANNSDMWNSDGFSMDSMSADHGHDCSAPPSSHVIDSLDDAVFQCRDHIMTSVAGGYAAAYLTPPSMLDFSNGEAVVRFDMSTARGSGRDWVDLWITPFADQLALPLNLWLPPYNGEPERAIQVKMEGSSRFEAYQFTPSRRSSAAQLPTASTAPYDEWLTPSATQRSTFELRLSRTHIKFCMPNGGRCWIDTALPVPLDWSRGVIQLAHHSYNATKDCTSDCVNSWHWDNVSANPAVPLDIVPASPRWDTATADAPSITLQRDAPSNAMVRFAAVGEISVSFDGGKTFAPAVRRSTDRRAPEHFSSYLQPIPAGTRTITFRGGPDSYISRWMVANINVLSGG